MDFRYALNLRKPKLLLRLVWAVMRSKVFKNPPLRYVDFAIGFECNLKCKHCFAVALEDPGHSKMGPADYSRVASECMALGTVNFSFQGGEPLLFRELGPIIAACRPRENVISVSTNGTLLTEGSLDQLKAMGVDILTVSLDSALASEHDKFRGVPGAHGKTMEGIRLALGKGFRVTLGTVVTHDTLRGGGVAGVVSLAERMRVLLYLIMPVPAGRWSENEDVLLSESDLERVQELTRGSPYVRTDLEANLGPYGCGAAKEILYITPYGDVLACPFMHISLGNTFQDSVKAIRERALQNPYFARYWEQCLVASDHEFITKHLSTTFGAKSLPVPYEQAFPQESSD